MGRPWFEDERVLRLALVAAGATLALVLALLVGCCTWRRLRPFFVSHRRTPYSWKVQRGRLAGCGHKGMAVFLIGMRINRWYRIDLWLPTLMAMSRMLAELQSGEYGYYGGETYGMLALLCGYPSLQVTYWDSVESIMDYSRGATHKRGMRHYVAAVARAKGAVGVWHEMYEVNQAEAMHRDMPSFGVVRAIGAVDAEGDHSTAQGRLHACPRGRAGSAESVAVPTETGCPLSGP